MSHFVSLSCQFKAKKHPNEFQEIKEWQISNLWPQNIQKEFFCHRHLQSCTRPNRANGLFTEMIGGLVLCLFICNPLSTLSHLKVRRRFTSNSRVAPSSHQQHSQIRVSETPADREVHLHHKTYKLNVVADLSVASLVIFTVDVEELFGFSSSENLEREKKILYF